ncbi:MAG: ABC transporter ATP-binding protein/permease [Bacilli bacterium]|nr:ABC transporter ATP-binding protein/permease [Bacilli bacterium]
MFKLMKRFVWRDWVAIALSAGLVVLQVYLELKMPEYTGKLVALVQNGKVQMNDVWANGGLMLLCSLGNVAAAVLCSLLLSRFANRLAHNLRVAIYEKVSSFSSAEMNRFSIPSLITRTTNDVAQIQMFFAIGLQMLLKSPILAIWAIAKISSTSVEWTTAVGVAIGVIAVVVGLVIAIALPKFRRIQRLIDDLNDVTRENITGVRVVRAFNAENYQEEKFGKANDKLTKNQLFTQRAMSFLMPTLNIVMNGLTLSIYWIGAILINRESVFEARVARLSEMAVFTQYALQIVMSFLMLVAVFIFLPRAVVSAKRVNEVLDTEPAIVDGPIEDVPDRGEIEFKDVAFSYEKGGEDTLEGISFSAKKGETVSFIGATGSGKTTVLNLLNRFYDCDGGEILVDGVNVKEYKQDSLRRKIGLISQKSRLFAGDIASNVAYGEVEPDEERVQQALRMAEADFVFDLEKGIHAEVAQGGTNFSGGQKQRLCIARALYKGAEILIFDDSFSALDYKTDMVVRQNLKKAFADKTVLIVAQRIGTIKDSDRIIVLDGGRIAGIGKHDELLSACPVYKEIALSQLDEEEL